jgi:hypothetical protein
VRRPRQDGSISAIIPSIPSPRHPKNYSDCPSSVIGVLLRIKHSIWGNAFRRTNMASDTLGPERSTKIPGIKVNQENVVATATRSSYDYAVNKLTQRTKVVTGGTAFGAAPTIDWGYYKSQCELVSGRWPSRDPIAEAGGMIARNFLSQAGLDGGLGGPLFAKATKGKLGLVGLRAWIHVHVNREHRRHFSVVVLIGIKPEGKLN